MAGAGKKWLMGCGLGCLAVVVIVAVLLGGTALLFKNTFSGWRNASTAMRELSAAQGETADFRPAWPGGVTADRLEILLAVRDKTAPSRTELANEFYAAQDRLARSDGKLSRLRRKIEAGQRLAPRLAEFMRLRSTALLEAGMNPGEYLYLYSLVYHCWLGHDPAAGVERFFMAMRREGRSFEIQIESGDEDADAIGDPAERLRQRLRAQHRRWLRSLLNDAPAPVPQEQQAWFDQVREELDRLDRRRDTLPWAERFPAAWQAELEPYRARLAASWDVQSNGLELLLLE
ncbi:MAG: hypothetical protein RBT60_06655 [Candidatus Krumholzibacteria bacterium]|jgi:hypothetical protein|nr:hypothetical protein [Candidatus Krumholzibacteria bacterium]